MKSLLTATLFASLAFAQTATPTPAPKTEQPKAEAKNGGCCGGNMSCCGSDKDKKDSKAGCCGGDSKEGMMCARKPMKDSKPSTEQPKK
jgi:hypothetical protein